MDYSIVSGRLAMGGAPPEHSVVPFHLLVLCAMEYQPPGAHFSCREVVHAPLDDAKPTQGELRVAILAARRARVSLDEGNRVLVTCWMGRNRSGLVTGMTLIELGHTADQAIVLIRKARGAKALSNGYFVRILHSYARFCQARPVHLSR